MTIKDLESIDLQYPEEEFQWQGRLNLSESEVNQSDRENLLKELWFFSVAHAAQGVIDFLTFAAKLAQDNSIPAGTVFFPDANRVVGSAGFDSRLQAWDKFPAELEWHPMAYAVCDLQTNCVVEQVETVTRTASTTTKVIPALAGAWGEVYRQHPPLEAQMEALRKATPEINAVSHFSYAWLEPERDRLRKSCNLF